MPPSRIDLAWEQLTFRWDLCGLPQEVWSTLCAPDSSDEDFGFNPEG